MSHFTDIDKLLDSEQFLIRTSLDYRAAQTSIDLLVGYDRNGRWRLGPSDETDNEAPPNDGPDATLIERNRTWPPRATPGREVTLEVRRDAIVLVLIRPTNPGERVSCRCSDRSIP